MYSGRKLVIPLDKHMLEQSLRVLIYPTVFVIFMLFSFRNTRLFFPFAVLLALLLFSLDHTYAQINSDKPAVLVDDKGIWVYNYGLLPWDTITCVSLRTVFTTPVEYIGITVRSRFELFKQVPWAGKMAIVWSVLFRYTPVLIYAKPEELQAILSLARYHHKT